MILRCAALLAACALPAAALELSDASRAALGRAILHVLSADEDVLTRAFAPPSYDDYVAADRALMAKHAELLFAGKDLAFVTCEASKANENCAEPLANLKALADARGLTLNILTLKDLTPVAEALDLTDPPYYILPRTLYRGALPDVVLIPELDELAAGK